MSIDGIEWTGWRTTPKALMPLTISRADGRALQCSKMGYMNSEITRELLQTAVVDGMPGWETRLFLITYPAGADGSGHSHPVPGIGYVLEGTMISAFDDGAEEIIAAGQSFQDEASFHRVSRNGSATEAMRFVIAYTVKVGEPNTTWPEE